MNRRFALSLALTLLCVPALAAKDVSDRLRTQLETLMPGEKADSIQLSPIAGLYEVVFGTQVYYMTEDGRYLLDGDMVDLKTRRNLTEQVRAKGQRAVMNSIPESSMIVFAPPKGKETKHTITVFTDIDCGYCRKLHSEMEQYNNLGIKVRYVAYPRAGIDSPSYKKAVAVWCAKDKQKAMTQAKSGEDVTSPNCDNPVKRHFEVARALNLSGTPTLVLQNGRMLPGYVPADRLREVLDAEPKG